MNKIYKQIICISMIAGIALSACGCGSSADRVRSEGMKKVGSLNVEAAAVYTDESEKEELIESFSSADGLCVIKTYPTYYDVTLDYEKGEPAEVGKAYAETILEAVPNYVNDFEHFGNFEHFENFDYFDYFLMVDNLHISFFLLLQNYIA